MFSCYTIYRIINSFFIGTSNQYASSSSDNKQSSLDIWSSMTNVFKNIVDSFSMSNENIITGNFIKIKTILIKFMILILF